MFIFTVIFCSFLALGVGYVLRQDGYERMGNACFIMSMIFSLYMLSLL